MSKKIKLALAAIPAVAFATGANAAAIDVGDVVTEIGAQVGPIGLIGSAILLVIVAIAAFGWVRRALRG